MDDLDARLEGVAALGEPVRRALYRYVVAQPQAVSRDQAAEAVGVAHHVAKFHLDKLADDGLLEVDYARPPGGGVPALGVRPSCTDVRPANWRSACPSAATTSPAGCWPPPSPSPSRTACRYATLCDKQPPN